MTRFVIDASLAGAWILPDEQSDIARAIRLGYGENISVVPCHWWLEVCNLLLKAERRGRLEPADTARTLALIARLPLEIDDAADYSQLMQLARRHQLTAYDAAYLELALRIDAPLATLDRKLLISARKEGVEVIE